MNVKWNLFIICNIYACVLKPFYLQNIHFCHWNYFKICMECALSWGELLEKRNDERSYKTIDLML